MVLLLATTLTGAALRWQGLTELPLHFDEILVLDVVDGYFDPGMSADPDRMARRVALITRPWVPPLARVFAANIHYMDAPPGYPVFLWAWLSVFPSSEFTLRFPAFLCSMAFIVAGFLLARRYMSDGAALFVAALLAVAPTQIYWARETREYAATMLSATLWLIAVARFLDVPTWKRARWVAVAGAACVLLQYGLVLLLAATNAYMLWRWWRKTLPPGSVRTWLIAHTLIALTVVFVGITLIPQLLLHSRAHLQGLMSSPTPFGAMRDTVLRTMEFPGFAFFGTDIGTFETGLLAIGVAVGLAVALARHRAYPLLAIWAFASALTAVGGVTGYYPYSLTRHCLFLAPFVYIFLGFAAEGILQRIPNRGRAMVAGIVVLVLLALGCFSPYRYHTEGFRQGPQVAQLIREQGLAHLPIYANLTTYLPVKHYLNDPEAQLYCRRFDVETVSPTTPAVIVLGLMQPNRRQTMADGLRSRYTTETLADTPGYCVLRITPPGP